MRGARFSSMAAPFGLGAENLAKRIPGLWPIHALPPIQSAFVLLTCGVEARNLAKRAPGLWPIRLSCKCYYIVILSRSDT